MKLEISKRSDGQFVVWAQMTMAQAIELPPDIHPRHLAYVLTWVMVGIHPSRHKAELHLASLRSKTKGTGNPN